MTVFSLNKSFIMTSSLRHPKFVGKKGCDELMAPYGQGFDNLLPVGLPYGEGSHGLCHIEDLVNTHANTCSFEQPFFFPLWEAASPLIIRPYIRGMGVESRMWRHFILFAVRRWQLFEVSSLYRSPQMILKMHSGLRAFALEKVLRLGFTLAPRCASLRASVSMQLAISHYKS